MSVAFSEPDYDGFRAFLVDANGFSGERVEAMIKRLRKVRPKKPQRRMDDFMAGARKAAPVASPHFAPAVPTPAPPVAAPTASEYVGPPTAGGSSSDDESSSDRTTAYPHSPTPPAREEPLAVGAAVELVGPWASNASRAAYDGRGGVVAEMPADIVDRGRVLVAVGDQTLSLKCRNVVAARPASPPRAAATPTPTPTQPSTAAPPLSAAPPPTPPPPAPPPTPTKSAALAKFLAGGRDTTTPDKKKRSAKALSSPPPKKSKKKKAEPATASLAADFFSGKVRDATVSPKKKPRKKKGGPRPCARAGAALADKAAEEESLVGLEVVTAEDLLAEPEDLD